MRDADQLLTEIDHSLRESGGVRLIRMPAHGEELLNLIVAHLTHHDFVSLRAGQHLSSDIRQHLHRHIALICETRSDLGPTARWVRRLSQISPRSHFVVMTHGAMPEAAPEATRIVPADIRERRAHRWLKSGRVSAARHWLVAARASADRRGDSASTSRIELDLCAMLVDAGRFSEAALRLRTILGMPDLDWLLYARAAALWGDVVIADGHARQADAWVRSVETELEMRRAPVPAVVRERRARIDFWLRPLICDRAPSIQDDSVEELGWRALAAWAQGRTRSEQPCRQMLEARRRSDRLAACWADILRGVSERASPSRVTTDAVLKRHHVALNSAVRTWLQIHGQNGPAVERTSREPHGREPEAELLRALRHIRRGTPFCMNAEIRQRLPGVNCFLTERTSMVSVDGLARLLKAIEESPDDPSALLAMCAWLRATPPVTHAAVVSADGRTFVAGLGWKSSDLSGHIATILAGPHAEAGPGELEEGCKAFALPIRYGGCTVGRLVIGLGAAATDMALQACRAAAMLCGPPTRACLDEIELRVRDRDGLHEIVGQSEAIESVRGAIARAAATPFPVLIEGESGTGKELAARALHRLRVRRERRFLAVNCAALTDELVEAELFGHTKGAFTGAVGPRSGLFEDAHGGTLFLDEVAELSARAQAKLLRVLQEREIRRVGESTARPVDVRVVCATNTPLAEAVAQGRFRDDLRFRLAVVSVRLPPLRERLEDIAVLTQRFWRRALLETGKRAYLGPDALACLTRHHWPGNVRELQNVVSGLAVAAPSSGRVTGRHVSLVIGQFSGTTPDIAANVPSLETARRVFERRVVAQAMARHAGRKTTAAHELGLTRQGLAKTLRRLGLRGDEHTADVA